MDILQVNDEHGRHYAKGEKKGKSVTSFIGMFQDYSWKDYWYKSLIAKIPDQFLYTDDQLLDMAKSAAQRVSDEASVCGTARHKEIEKLLLAKTDTFLLNDSILEFVEFVKPYADLDRDPIELPVFLEKPGINLGGTLDALLEVDAKVFKNKSENQLAIVDWKFPKKYKSPSMTANYFLQLSIYREAVKHTYDLQVDTALLVMSPTNEDKVYIRVLEKNDLDYYSSVFSTMIDHYNEDTVSEFNWNDFSKGLTSLKKVGYLSNVQHSKSRR